MRSPQVRPPCLCHAADVCVFPENINLALAVTATFAQCFNCNLESYLVAVLETVFRLLGGLVPHG